MAGLHRSRFAQMRQPAGVLLGALVWLWPVVTHPVPEAWPNMVAWSAGAWLGLVVLARREQGDGIVAQGWLLAALVSAVLGLVQYFGYSGLLSPFLAIAPAGHAWANTHQTNHLASLLAVGLWVLAWMQAQGRWLRHLHWIAALLAVALAATASRGGFLQLLLVSALALWWGHGRRGPLLRLYSVALASYGVAMFALPWVLEHWLGVVTERHLLTRMAVEGTCSSRLVLWRNVLELIAQKPWAGWGWNGLSYGHFITLYDAPRFCGPLSNAHNLPLHLAVELGVPVAAALCLSVAGTCVWLRPWRETDASVQLGWGALAVVGLHSMLEYPLWYGNFQVMVALAVWLLWPAVRQRLHIAKPEPGQPVALGKRVVIAMVVQLALVGMAWDYVRVSQLYTLPAQRLAPWRENTWESVRHSVFFGDQILFARVAISIPGHENAAVLLGAALEALRVAPEPLVIERVIVSASLLGRQDLVEFYAKRYAAAWPKQYAAWRAAQVSAVSATPTTALVLSAVPLK